MKASVKLWNEIALSDLKTARLLHENGHYRTSYFFFQQASEKANKAFALFQGDLSLDKLKKFQHDQFKIFKHQIEKQKVEIEKLNKILEIFPLFQESQHFQKSNLQTTEKQLDVGLEFIKESKESDLINISSIKLNFLLRELKKLKNIKLKYPKNRNQVFKKQMLDMSDWIGNFTTQDSQTLKTDLINLLESKEQSENFYDEIFNKYFPLIFELFFAYMTLYFSAMITIQHSSKTRYPDEDLNPDRIYTKCLPIIIKQPKFMDFLENAIQIVNKINEMNPNVETVNIENQNKLLRQ